MAQLLLGDLEGADLSINLAMTSSIGNESPEAAAIEFTARLVHARVLLAIPGREKEAQDTVQALSSGENSLISRHPQPLNAALLSSREKQLVKVVTSSRTNQQIVKGNPALLTQAPGIRELLEQPVATAALGASQWTAPTSPGSPDEDAEDEAPTADLLPNGVDGNLLPLYLHAGIACPFEKIASKEKVVWEWQRHDRNTNKVWWEPYALEHSRIIEAAQQSNGDNPKIEVQPGQLVLINWDSKMQYPLGNGRGTYNIRRREIQDLKDKIEELPFGVGELWGLSAAACMHSMALQQMLSSVAESDEATAKLVKMKTMEYTMMRLEEAQVGPPLAGVADEHIVETHRGIYAFYLTLSGPI